MDSYVAPTAGITTTGELEVKRSRFITLICRVTSEDEARAFIQATRAEYPDARHHCSAFIYAVEGANPVERSSDDGEPSGTAGQPMLDVLRGSGMLDIAAVVVRYFGGVKLGTGGLVRAYSDAVSLVLPRGAPRASATADGVGVGGSACAGGQTGGGAAGHNRENPRGDCGCGLWCGGDVAGCCGGRRRLVAYCGISDKRFCAA